MIQETGSSKTMDEIVSFFVDNEWFGKNPNKEDILFSVSDEHMDLYTRPLKQFLLSDSTINYAALFEMFEIRYPMTADQWKKFTVDVPASVEECFYIIDFLLYRLQKEVFLYRDPEVEDLIRMATNDMIKAHGDLLTFFLSWLKANIKTAYSKEYIMSSRISMEINNQAYDFDEYLELLYYLYNESYILENEMYEQAARSKNYTDTWLFLSLHFICALRTTDMVRLYHPTLPYEPEHCLKDIEAGDFRDEDAITVLLSITYRLCILPLKPNKTSSYEGIPSIKFTVPESCQVHIGRLFALAEAHRLIAGDPDDTPLIRRITSYDQISRYMGDEIGSLFLEANFRTRSANKSYLQAIFLLRVKMQDGKYMLVDCPACSKSYQLLSNSFKFPELKKRFLSEKNGCAFDDVSGDARKKLYWWHCDLCGEDFESVISNMIRGLSTSSKGCTYCAGKSVKRENSFGVRHPELLSEYSKENTIDPFAVTEFSSLTVKWNCLIHKDTQWESSFHSRAIGYGSCPICKNYNYSGKFSEKYPDFKKWYDSEKNIRPFESYSIQSNEPVWWKCEKGHSFQWPVDHWNNTGKFVCKVCDGTIIIPGVNDLESQNPKLAKELSPAFEKKANEIYYQAVTPVLWRCIRCQADYARRVCDREVGDDTCPYCKGKLVNEDINSLKARKPELILEWSSKNSKNVSEVYWLSTQYAIWNCPKCNMEYEAVIKNRYAGDTACPYCNGRTPIPGVNSVDIVKPWLVSEWSQKNDRPITEFLETSSYYAKWNCSNCGEEFSAEIRNRGSDGDCDCPYCNGRKPIPGVNSVDIIKPQLALEWSPANKRSITEFLETSSYYAKWVCLACKGTFSAKIKDRDEQDDACPYCRRTRVLPGVNSADVEKPWLLDEWSPDNAEPLRNYMISSSYRALWICPTCNQEYEASIRSRTKGDNICPCCTKRRAYPGVNTFAVLHKDLMKRWSWQNNYLLCDPDQILERYNKVVWWECPKCKQLYRCSPQKILYYEKRHMESCSFCKGYRRKQRHFI